MNGRQPAIGVAVLSMLLCASTNKGLAISLKKPVTNARVLSRYMFLPNNSLFNIANDMIAQQKVNVEKAGEIGVKILQFMVGTSTKEFTFRKAYQAVTLGSQSSVKNKGDPVHVDPQLLFIRLVTVRERCELCETIVPV